MTPLELDPNDREPSGIFDVRYVAFLQTLTHLRTPLHRYCARMTGSLLDGEDVMQEAIFEAYRKLDQLDDPAALRPWLFRIAHHRCLDFIRKRTIRHNAEAQLELEDITAPTDAPSVDMGHAVERLVLHLPPKERACVLLKDVLDYSLEEIAEFVDSTTGGVKAALSRGRSKLAALAEQPPPALTTGRDTAVTTLLSLYIERFNRRDWNGVRELISADARLLVADRYVGRLADSPYFGKYEEQSFPWYLALGEVEGEPVVLVQPKPDADPTWAVRLVVAAGRIAHIRDYHFCPWILASAEDIQVTRPDQLGESAWNP